MDILTIVHYTSYALVFLLLISFPLRYSLFSRKIGICLLSLKTNKARIYIMVILLSIIMLVVLYFKDFSLIVTIALDGTALLAVEMSLREFLNRSKAGVYEAMLVADGKVIKKDDIISVGKLDPHVDSDRAITVITESKGDIVVFFETKKDRDSVTSILKSWKKK